MTGESVPANVMAIAIGIVAWTATPCSLKSSIQMSCRYAIAFMFGTYAIPRIGTDVSSPEKKPAWGFAVAKPTCEYSGERDRVSENGLPAAPNFTRGPFVGAFPLISVFVVER